MKVYFDKIRNGVKAADELFLFGPAETKNARTKNLQGIKDFKGEIRAVETADSITENRKIVRVRDFFKA